MFLEAVHVAPIQYDILLGLDFLLKHRVNIKLGELQLDVTPSNDIVPIEVVSSDIEGATVAKATNGREIQVF